MAFTEVMQSLILYMKPSDMTNNDLADLGMMEVIIQYIQ